MAHAPASQASTSESPIRGGLKQLTSERRRNVRRQVLFSEVQVVWWKGVPDHGRGVGTR